MNKKKVGKTIFSNNLFSLPISTDEKMVLICLHRFQHSKDGIFPSLAKIGLDCSFSRYTASACLKHLVEMGYTVMTKKPAQKGRFSTYEYKINYDQIEKDAFKCIPYKSRKKSKHRVDDRVDKINTDKSEKTAENAHLSNVSSPPECGQNEVVPSQSYPEKSNENDHDHVDASHMDASHMDASHVVDSHTNKKKGLNKKRYINKKMCVKTRARAENSHTHTEEKIEEPKTDHRVESGTRYHVEKEPTVNTVTMVKLSGKIADYVKIRTGAKWVDFTDMEIFAQEVLKETKLSITELDRQFYLFKQYPRMHELMDMNNFSMHGMRMAIVKFCLLAQQPIHKEENAKQPEKLSSKFNLAELAKLCGHKL